MLEAMACGLPVLATEVTDPEALPPDCGQLLPIGDKDALVEGLKWFNLHREVLSVMGRAARKKAEGCSWKSYRRHVSGAVAPFV